MTSFPEAKRAYLSWGVDVESAIHKAASQDISINCWQGDDVSGFESKRELSGGIQVTGSYPGKARNFTELCSDFTKAISLIPGKKRLNLHSSYAVTNGESVDRDELKYEHFLPWVNYACENNLGLDFNPTLFADPHVKNGLTLSSPDELTRQFWIEHCIACRKIAHKISEALDDEVLNNLWIPDGLKDQPGDRLGPRLRLRDSLDRIYEEALEGVIDSVESKVFGIGLESYTVGSHDFYLNYSANHPGVYCLLDLGHFHPKEVVADKLSSILCFTDRLPLHITRSVQWDSDHVPNFDDTLRELFNEIIRCDALDKVILALDFFDASINRVAAWVIGARNVQKALLWALLQNHSVLKHCQDQADYTKAFILREEAKTLPFGAVWQEYCRRQNVPQDGEWHSIIVDYERDVLDRRG